MTLEQIAIKHGTLKVQHGYMPIYERFFEPLRKTMVNLLEIGVHEGASLKTWFDYFPYGYICGVDKVLKFQHDRMDLRELDAAKDFGLMQVGPLDIIIDDGSHIAYEQLASFRGLWDTLKPGGLYVIEDLFALYDPVWNPSGPNIIDELTGRMKSILVGGDSIQEVHWFGRNDINGILFLRKRYESFRVQPLSEFTWDYQQ